MNRHIKEIGLAASSGILTALAFPRLSLFFSRMDLSHPFVICTAIPKAGPQFFFRLVRWIRLLPDPSLLDPSGSGLLRWAVLVIERPGTAVRPLHGQLVGTGDGLI